LAASADEECVGEIETREEEEEAQLLSELEDATTPTSLSCP